MRASTRGGAQLPGPSRTQCKICAAFYAGKVSPYAATGSTMFFMLKAFGAGVILATGFIHMWPDANESFSNSCLGEQCARLSTVRGTGPIGWARYACKRAGLCFWRLSCDAMPMQNCRCHLDCCTT